VDLGHGNRLQLDPEAFRALLHHLSVVAAITQRAQDIADTANALAEPVGREGRERPQYGVTIQNSSDTTRARARVYPSNHAGVLDDAKNATLYKSMLVHPCDPIPTASETAKPDEPWSPG
jgi:hypothetical protein